MDFSIPTLASLQAVFLRTWFATTYPLRSIQFNLIQFKLWLRWCKLFSTDLVCNFLISWYKMIWQSKLFSINFVVLFWGRVPKHWYRLLFPQFVLMYYLVVNPSNLTGCENPCWETDLNRKTIGNFLKWLHSIFTIRDIFEQKIFLEWIIRKYFEWPDRNVRQVSFKS